VADVVLLSLASSADSADSPDAPTLRVPVLACADTLREHGLTVDCPRAHDDEEVDAALGPVVDGGARLVVAADTDAQLRAVIRRLVRRYAPPPSRRPAELPAERTVFDLPPLAVLPLAPAVPELVVELDLPRDPAAVAAAVLAGQVRRFDLLRTDAGSVTVHGCLLGGVGAAGKAVAWRARIEVDDATLTDGSEPLVACSLRNAGVSHVDGLPLVVQASADDGAVSVAVAIPHRRARLLGGGPIGFEVRRARGRAVNVTPATSAEGGDERGVICLDDGVAGRLTRARTWWVERGAWAAYVAGGCP
jgi:hypothetical protein